MSNIFFHSDYHFGHQKVFSFCPQTRSRWDNVDQMDEELIEIWNSRIQPGDTFYFLGDFSYHRDEEKTEKIFKALKGQKFLCVGNHDPRHVRKLAWSGVFDYRRIKIDKQVIILHHYPIAEWDLFFRQSWHLYGHVHGRTPLPDSWKALDVGFDGKFQLPISFDELQEYMLRRENTRKDAPEWIS